MAGDANALTAKEELFVEEYLQRMNATQAAIAAGYSKRSARQIGSRLLTKDDIRARVQERLDEAAADADEVLRKLTDHLRGSMADFTHIDGAGHLSWDFRKAKRLGVMHLVQSITVETETRTFGAGEDALTSVKESVKVELYSVQAAAQMLGKHHRLFDRALEDDWRGELIRAGLNPDEELDRLANEFFARIPANVQAAPGAGSADGAGIGEGAGAGDRRT